MQAILDYLKDRGERLDLEIAKGVGLSLEDVRQRLTSLTASGEVIMCQSIRFHEGKRVEGMLCRIAGYIPPPSPGRKAKAKTPA